MTDLGLLSTLDDKVNDLLSRGAKADKKVKGGLFSKIAQDLLGASSGDSVAEVVPILRDLLVQGKLSLPDDALSAADAKPEQTDHVKVVLKELLKAAGRPELALASSAAIDIFKKAVDSCGANRDTTVVKGLEVGRKRDRDVILYFVEETSSGPNLPLVDGSRDVALERLEQGFLNWAVQMKLDVVPVGKQEEANLIVTGRAFGKSTTMLAETDIGPPRGRQLRMVFNLSKDFDGDKFEACAAHEFGHMLGIFHEDVDMGNKSLCMYQTNLGVKMPQAGDIAAAVKKQWRV